MSESTSTNARIISVRGFLKKKPGSQDWPTETICDAVANGGSAVVFGTLFDKRDHEITFEHRMGDELPEIFRCGAGAPRVDGYQIMAITDAEIDLGSNQERGGYEGEAAQFGEKTLITVTGPDLTKVRELVDKIASGQFLMY